MYKPPIRGKIIKKKEESPKDELSEKVIGIAGLVYELKTVEDEIIKTTNEKLAELDESIGQVVDAANENTQRVEDALMNLEEVAVQTIEQMKDEVAAIEPVPGPPGEPGIPADEEKIVETVLSRIPKLDEKKLEIEILKKVPKLDEKSLLKKFIAKIPENKASLKVIQENFETDPMSVINKIMAMPEGKFKLKTTNIDGLEQTMAAFRSQLGKGYLHGGGASLLSQLNDVALSSLSNGQALTYNSNTGKWNNTSIGGSGTVTSVASADGSITVTNPTTTVDLAVVKAPILSTARNIAITGDLAWSVNFDGSTNVTAAGTLATVNGNVGTFGSATQSAQITVNGKGLVTAVSNVTITPAASSITGGQALTKTDDTNVTLTLGGSPTTALLAATSLTLGWTGTLGVTRGGTGTGTQFTAGSVIFAGASGVYTQDNASFFFDDANNRLALGTTAPGTRLSVTEQATIQTAVSGSTAQFVGTDANPLRITLDTHNNASSSGTAMMFRRSRGTSTTPSAVQSGDVLASLNARGYGDSQYAAASTGVLSWKANQTFTNTANGTYLSIDTTPDGSVTAAEVARFTSDRLRMGVAGTMLGKIDFAGSTSGNVTVQGAADGGTSVNTLQAVTDTFVYRASTDTLTNKSIVATQLTGTAYTFAANNTNGTAAYTLQNYEDHPLATYAGTFTWNSTPPTTIVSQQYAWSRIGNTVTLFVAVFYTNAGATNTTCAITLPSDCPTPAVIAGAGDAASEYMYPVNGARVEGNMTGNPTAVRGGLRKNASNNGYEVNMIFGSVSATHLEMTVIYRTS